MLKSFYKLFLFIYFLSINNLLAENNYVESENCLINTRITKFEKSKLIAQKIKNLQLKNQILIYNELTKNTGLKTTPNFSCNTKDKFTIALNNLNKALYAIYYKYGEELKAYNYLNTALDIAILLESKPLICEICKTILSYYTTLMTIDDNSYSKYYEIYLLNAYDNSEKLLCYSYYLNLNTNKNIKRIDNKIINHIKTLSNSEINTNIKCIAYRYLGIYIEETRKDFNEAKNYYEKGIELSKPYINIPYYKLLFTKLIIDISACYSKLNESKKAISLLHQIEFKENNKLNDYLNIYKNSWLSECYEKEKRFDSAYYHRLKSNKLKNLLDQSKHNSLIILSKSKEKDQQIKSLSQKFNQHKILYLSLIFLVFLLALYSFIRWKKVDLNKKKISLEKENLELEKENLETQHHQTLEQLEKVKQLVIEDHIILKNKAKIYLEELLYIKAEDHYLQLITTGKKEFVRGKISEIVEELPPNFVKCHRSYIININYIKQNLTASIVMKNNDEVPVARGFKM